MAQVFSGSGFLSQLNPELETLYKIIPILWILMRVLSHSLTNKSINLRDTA